MEILFNYLKIIERELDYQKKVYRGKTEKYRELKRKREVVLTMINIINNS